MTTQAHAANDATQTTLFSSGGESTVDFLARIARAGVRVWIDAGKLRYHAPAGSLSRKLVAEMRARKDELSAALRASEARSEAKREAKELRSTAASAAPVATSVEAMSEATTPAAPAGVDTALLREVDGWPLALRVRWAARVLELARFRGGHMALTLALETEAARDIQAERKR